MTIPEALGIPEHGFRLIIGRTKTCGYEGRVHDRRCVQGKAQRATDTMSIHDCGDLVLMVATIRPGKILGVISFRRRQQERELFRQKMGHAKLSDRLR